MVWSIACAALVGLPSPMRPVLSEFIGLNVHTVLFMPELYAPAAKILRNYHPVSWNLGDSPSNYPAFPACRNGVRWDALYGNWAKAGFKTSACLMFEEIESAKWTSKEDAFAYGYCFGRYFGPKNWVESVEIGNEPGKFSDDLYSKIFEAMASGIRRASRDIKIATCAVRVGKSGDYHKSVDCLKGKEALYDVLSIHSYAQAEPWPTFKRSYPEDPKLTYLKDIRELISWRDKNAPGKRIWLTEFGYDSSTKAPDPNGDWAKWQGNTDLEQAQWIVRSILEFVRLDIDRAYLYWFNDEDKPMMHGSSGLTRNYQPKPSFYALAYLQRALGPYRYVKDVVRQAGRLFAIEFAEAKNPDERCWAVWVPARNGEPRRVQLPAPTGTVKRVEILPLEKGEPREQTWRQSSGKLELQASCTPVFVFWKNK